MAVDESKFYEITCSAVQELFRIQSYSVDFEITGYKGKRVPDRFLKDEVLLRYKQHLPTPDIMGLVQKPRASQKLVVVEFKLKPTFMDIFQAKGYDALFGSDFTFLISQYPIYTSSRKVLDFVVQKPGILRTNQEHEIFIQFLHRTPEGKVTLAQLGTEVGILPSPIL